MPSPTVAERDNEAAETFAAFFEPLYARLGRRGKDQRRRSAPPRASKEKSKKKDRDQGLFGRVRSEDALADVRLQYWRDVRDQWAERILRQRALDGLGRKGRDAELPGAGVPGANNWVQLGPSVVLKGQATGRPPISGRASRLAIAPGGSRVYVASADGGVWRSDDSGESWSPKMDGFDVDPAATLATSNTCGAIAIDLADPDRVYVGTGEGDVDEIFGTRLLTSLPAYRGVGAIVSSTGGASWTREPTDSPATSLLGGAFFALAVDPLDRERVIAATTLGLYRREADGMGGYHWVHKRANKHTSVIACVVGSTTTFFAAEWGVGVFTSNDGDGWSAVGTGFPTGIGRISLAARPTDPSIVYALVAAGGSFEGLHRLDGMTGPWRTVGGLPGLGGQADYNLALEVDPNDANRVYMAGSAAAGGDGAIFRCNITSAGSGGGLTYSMASAFIGGGVHADVHDLMHVPTDSSTLWVGCDGGVFRTTDATGSATFTHRNTGLATLCCNAFAQHPSEPAVLIVGLQDNGTARYVGEEAWRHIADGDGGTPIIDWAAPENVMVKINRDTYLATDGGQSISSFGLISGGAAPIFGAPLVTTPYNPGAPADAGFVAFGSGRINYGQDLYISSTFGSAWTAPVTTLSQRIFALAFANSSRLYVGTTGGQVYRLDRTGSTWSSPTRLDNVAAGPLPLAGLVTDVEVDPADPTSSSIYITLGGVGDARHVWHFDGTQWTSRSGSGSNQLLDSSHNAIAADPSYPTNLYAAADIGVWHSTDSGTTWSPLQNGLPDAAVFDLQFHPTTRLLRASTHGRGMYELRVDPPSQLDVELYSRDTALDVGRFTTVDGQTDPETWPATPVRHYLSRNIKVDVPTPAGYQTASTAIDFLQFNDVIVDGSQGVGTLDPSVGTVVSRVYVEVHNRGVVAANDVQVMLLLTRPAVALAPLPAGYQTSITSGIAISDANWQTVGVKALTNLRAGFPQIAEFNLPSTMLPPPADLPAHGHHCLVAFVHSLQDPYSSTDAVVDSLTVADRKVAQRNLQVIPFVGTPPPPGTVDTWVAVDLFGVDPDNRTKELLLDTRGFNGRVSLLLHPELAKEAEGMRSTKRDLVDPWAEHQEERLRAYIEQGRFDPHACRRMISDIHAALDFPLLTTRTGGKSLPLVRGIRLPLGERLPLFLRLEPDRLKMGVTQELSIMQYDVETRQIEGGNTWRLTAVPEEAGRSG